MTNKWLLGLNFILLYSAAILASFFPHLYFHHYFFISGFVIWLIQSIKSKNRGLFFSNISLIIIYSAGLVLFWM